MSVSLNIEFGGGLELLFSNQRRHRVELPRRVPSNATNAHAITNEITAEVPMKDVDLAFLVLFLRDRVLKERPELFVEKGTV